MKFDKQRAIEACEGVPTGDLLPGNKRRLERYLLRFMREDAANLYLEAPLLLPDALDRITELETALKAKEIKILDLESPELYDDSEIAEMATKRLQSEGLI